MSRTVRVAIAVMTTVAAGLAAGACAQPPDRGPARPIVLVSGRDDHGLVRDHNVTILDRPSGSSIGAVHDGTLVRVVSERGEWLQVRTVAGPRREGWLNDFYTRGTVHVRAERGECTVTLASTPGGVASGTLLANTQVEVLDTRRHRKAVWALVRTPEAADAGWLPVTDLDEAAGDVVVQHDGACRVLAPATNAADHH